MNLDVTITRFEKRKKWQEKKQQLTSLNIISFVAKKRSEERNYENTPVSSCE